MPAIHVCPLSRLSATVAETGARHVVTLIGAGTPVLRPMSVRADDHLLLHLDDILEPMDGMTHPGEAHVETFLDFFRAWDRAHPVVVHCWAGVSRSTAGAFSALCLLRPDLDEATIAGRLRARSKEATPNALFVRAADRLLKRDGRMSAAVSGIGCGAHAFEGSVFALRVDE